MQNEPSTNEASSIIQNDLELSEGVGVKVIEIYFNRTNKIGNSQYWEKKPNYNELINNFKGRIQNNA